MSVRHPHKLIQSAGSLNAVGEAHCSIVIKQQAFFMLLARTSRSLPAVARLREDVDNCLAFCPPAPPLQVLLPVCSAWEPPLEVRMRV